MYQRNILNVNDKDREVKKHVTNIKMKCVFFMCGKALGQGRDQI